MIHMPAELRLKWVENIFLSDFFLFSYNMLQIYMPSSQKWKPFSLISRHFKVPIDPFHVRENVSKLEDKTKEI